MHFVCISVVHDKPWHYITNLRHVEVKKVHFPKWLRFYQIVFEYKNSIQDLCEDNFSCLTKFIAGTRLKILTNWSGTSREHSFTCSDICENFISTYYGLLYPNRLHLNFKFWTHLSENHSKDDWNQSLSLGLVSTSNLYSRDQKLPSWFYLEQFLSNCAFKVIILSIPML